MSTEQTQQTEFGENSNGSDKAPTDDQTTEEILTNVNNSEPSPEAVLSVNGNNESGQEKLSDEPPNDQDKQTDSAATEEESDAKCECSGESDTKKAEDVDEQTSSSSNTLDIDDLLTNGEESNSIDSHLTDNNVKDETLKVELPPLLGETSKPEGASSDLTGADEGANAAPLTTDPNVYHVKWISYRNKDIPTITQNENGPCPLIAIMNVLLLKGQVHLSQNTEVITPDQLMTYIGNCILENAPKSQDTTEAVQLNYEQNMHDAMAVIHKLQTGLDVNVRFTGVSDFEYTPECIIFDLLSIPLYHGWLVDPQDKEVVNAVGTCSYNQLVEKIITQRSSDKSDMVTEALICEAFLDRAAAQLTYHGLCELNSVVKENQLCVFFRNNHFSTMYRHQNELFLLVTDQGFLGERNVVWETLSNVEGDGYFVDANFHTYRKPPLVEPVIPAVQMDPEEQVDQDYLLAMSLQHEQQMRDEEVDWNQSNSQDLPAPQLSDHELAARMQAEEDQRLALEVQRREQRHQQPSRGAGGGTPQHHASQGRPRERKRERGHSRDSAEKSKDCQIL